MFKNRTYSWGLRKYHPRRTSDGGGQALDPFVPALFTGPSLQRLRSTVQKEPARRKPATARRVSIYLRRKTGS